MHQAKPDDTHSHGMFGEWLSLVEHLVRDQGVGGSNPLSPTNTFNHLQTGDPEPLGLGQMPHCFDARHY